MATRIRTIDFLPEIFQTNTNDQFLSATLDQLVQPPDFRKVQGYIGSKFGYGVKTTDQYVEEPTVDKRNYQLEPTVVFTDPVTGKVTDAITYPGIIDAIKLESGLTPNHNSLFKNEFYSWDSFVDLDKLINFGQYYWIPEGPESVDITTTSVLQEATIKVISNVNSYQFEVNGSLLPTENPTLTLVRGGTYTFQVDEKSKFYIQSLPGMDGVDPNRKNFSTREINGIEFNGVSSGTFTYNVPTSNAEDDNNYPGRVPIDLVTTLSFDNVHGRRLYDIKNIDGVINVADKTLLFYGTNPNERAIISDFFDSDNFDTVNFENFIREPITSTIFKITLVGDQFDPVIKLVPLMPIADNTTIVIAAGTEYIDRKFVKNSYGEISLIPSNTSAISTLYYQDEGNSLKFGKIKLIDDTVSAVIDVLDIIGQKAYTSPNGIKFSNGLRVKFVGRVFPTKYLHDTYYVEGVGTSIQLIPSSELIVPELYSQEFSAPFDDPASGFDQVGFGDVINLPYTPDYITISRNSIDRNGWTRGNRWFHVDVLKTISENNLLSPIVNKALTTGTNRASRPIIEFYPNLKLIYHGTFGKTPVDYIDTVNTDALNTIAGIDPNIYLPDGENSSLFDGCRIIFAKDRNPEVVNKIFVANIATVNGSRVITLTKASDGDVTSGDQVIIVNGVTNKGYNYYYDSVDGWVNSQTKTTVNQAPLFDLFDSNGISLGDGNYYPGTDFKGCTLFQYSVGSGVKDTVLGIPIQYSGVGNLNDINFESTLNSQSFNYVSNGQSINEPVNYGYVYQYTNKTNYVRKLGWETAVDTSFQYQVFDYTYTNINTTNTFTLDVPLRDSTSTAWPVSVVYVNNTRIDAYTTTVTNTQTVVVITQTLAAGDLITILAYSDVVSNIGYYQVPSNLQQNPFNYQVTTINAGDIRGHYKSICNNIPGLTGQSFGANNYRDLGNPVPYGTRIIQNSATMVTAAAFIRRQEANFFNGVNYNATEYVKFKSLLINTVNSQDYTPYDSASDILDDALDIITSAKSQSSPFFWSDMLPSKTPAISNTYTFAVGVTNTVYPLSKVYDFNNANYESVLVYSSRLVNGIMQNNLMLKGVDYFVNPDAPYLVLSAKLNDGDTVTVKEYSQTYGSFVPSTPSKVGLYPVSIPEIILDETYLKPTYFIKGHDGSLTKMYDTFDDYGNIIDFRDKVLFEFECRIYNNIKVNAKTPIVYADIFPGQFRTTDYSYDQIMQLYKTSYLNWVGLNRIDTASQYYDSTNEYTWNYSKAKNKLDNTTLKQGYWRGIYLWFYDTATPHATPWEMLGLPVKPTWWDERYGLGPYTSENLLLWTDLSNGYIYNNGESYIDKNYIRPDLLSILPVNSRGELLSPFESVIRNYNKTTFNNDWVIGDVGPAEYSYRKSSTWPFDLMRIFALAKPAQFFTLGLDLDVYKYNYEFNQYLVYNRFRTTGRQQLQLYGNDANSAAHSYMNWIIDYLNQYGLPGTQQVANTITYVDVRLSYRVSGYTDKNKVNFYIEKGSPNSTNSSLIVPDDSYTILQYTNEPNDTIVYSSVIVQKTTNGYKVYGNSQNKTYFISSIPTNTTKQKLITVLNLKVNIYSEYSTQVQYTSYGTEYKNITDLANLLASYGNYLTTQGVIFDDVENNTVLDWNQMIAEVLYWVQTGWEVGSVINLNPCSNKFHIEKPIGIIQPFTLTQNNFVLNQNLIPVNLNDLAIYRKDTTFKMKILTNGDTISYLRADTSIAEHIVIFDNETVFNDVLYNLITGLRQQRLYLKGSKTNQWDGTLYAPGFIQNQNNVVDWKENTKYTKGTIVIYKRKYWMANKTVIVPTNTFDFNDWSLTSYDKIDTGILANPNTRASESEYYYDTRRSNIQNDGDLLGFSLIGYRPRSYLADADLDDISQVNIYKNMIAEKGTLDIINSFQGATIQNNDLAYTINENWAIKNSEYGGVLNHNFVEFTLDENLLTGNPAIVSLINGNNVDIAEQQVPLYNIKNYGRTINTTSVLPTIGDNSITSLPSAGYANLDDITLYSYTVERISNLVTNLIYKNDYIWIADKQGDWNVYTPIGLDLMMTSLVNNLNNTCTINFATPHGLSQYDTIAVINKDTNTNTIINGFYTVEQISNNKSIIITLALASNITTVMFDNPVLIYRFQPMRVSSPTKINTLPLLNFEYTTAKVWVDQTATNNWAVYQKNINYYDVNFEIPNINNGKLGSAVAYLPQLGYYISDPNYIDPDLGPVGRVYKYIRSGIGTIRIDTITKDVGFGTTMARSSEFMIVSQPSDTVSKLYVYRIVSLQEVAALVEEQVLTVNGTYAGTSMAFSGDSNYLFVGAPKVNSVLYFHRQVDYTLLPVLGNKQDTPLISQLAAPTNPLDKFFVVDGNAKNSIPQGKRITFLQYKQYNTSVILGFGFEGKKINLRIGVTQYSPTIVTNSTDVISDMKNYSTITIGSHTFNITNITGTTTKSITLDSNYPDPTGTINATIQWTYDGAHNVPAEDLDTTNPELSLRTFGTTRRNYYFSISGELTPGTHIAIDPTNDNTDYLVTLTNYVYDLNTNVTKFYVNDYCNPLSYDLLFKTLDTYYTYLTTHLEFKPYFPVNTPAWTYTNLLPDYVTVITSEYIDTIIDTLIGDGTTTTFDLTSTDPTGVVRNKIDIAIPNSNYGHLAKNYSNIQVSAPITILISATNDSNIVTTINIAVTTSMIGGKIVIYNDNTYKYDTFIIADIDASNPTKIITLDSNFKGNTTTSPINAKIIWSNIFNYQLVKDKIILDVAPAKDSEIIVTTTIDKTVIHTVERIGYSLSINQLAGIRNDFIDNKNINHGSSYLQEIDLNNGDVIASNNIFIATVNNQFNFMGPINMSSFDTYYLGKNPGDLKNPREVLVSVTNGSSAVTLDATFSLSIISDMKGGTITIYNTNTEDYDTFTIANITGTTTKTITLDSNYNGPTSSDPVMASIAWKTVLYQSNDNFGASIAVNYDASKIFIGSPTYHVRLVDNETIPPSPNVGIVWAFDRLIETFKLDYNPDILVIALPWPLDNFLMDHTRISLNGKPLSKTFYNVRYAGQIPEIFFSKVLGIKAGDVITVSSPSLVLMQSLTSYDNIDGVIANQQFGTSIATNNTGSEVIVGAIYDQTKPGQNGAVYRFTNEAKRYGFATAEIVANLQPITIGGQSVSKTILFINGYSVFLDFTNGLDAYGIANAINLTKVPNIFAYVTEDDRLVIRLLSVELGADNNKLNITAFNGNYFYLMGIAPYTKTQIIREPHVQNNSQFGYRVAFNEQNSFVVTAPKADRYAGTFFDMISSEMHYNTVFDLNLTTFEDVFYNAGAAYMYDYIKPYNESLLNSGEYIYSQPVNDSISVYGALPLYGNSLSFNDNIIVIGSPNFVADQVGGRVTVYENAYGSPNWSIYRNSTNVVDIDKIQKVQLYNNITDENLVSLDYIDPLRGKLLGAVRENLDFIGISDPAGYNHRTTVSSTMIWSIKQVGKTWFNTSTTRFLNYHQDDLAYNAKYWGQIFPGSDVTVYTWIESDVTPVNYTGPGTPYDLQKYTSTYAVNSNNSLVQNYYYWVRNTNAVHNSDKTLTDSILERYITRPQNSGISYMAPLRSDTYALYNVRDYINGLHTNMHLGFGSGSNEAVIQNQFKLIQNNNPSDFLPGLPNYSLGHDSPEGLYNRLLESFAGVDLIGSSVPNYTLPAYMQTGIGVRPRQSMFIDRFNALKNYLGYANKVLAQYPINEFSNLTYLAMSGDYFDTSSYWSNIYWWATGYNDTTKTKIEVGMYADLYKLTATEGLIVGVAKNGQGKREVYIYTSGAWTRIGLQNGTIQFSSKLWDYQTNKIGFGDNFFDTDSFDTFPALETYYIIRALNEQIFTGPLLEHRNKSLILMFEYIQSENVSGNNYLPWLNKTSFADVTYTVRDLQQEVNYHVDNTTLLSGYINEVKPYHTVIKDFDLRYTHTDNVYSNTTDFDINPIYNSKTGKFISPQLSFINPNNTKNEYAIGDSIWTNSNYTDWHSNYGLSLKDIPNFEIGILKIYMTPTSNTLLIDNARGMPDAGTLYIDSEIIGYNTVNRDTGLVSGLTRGINNSYVSDHYPGIVITMDLPGVVVLETGRGYIDPPKITAHIDTTIYPSPTREAVLEPVMSDGKVISINIIDPGENYPVTPEIRFTSSYDVKFAQSNLNFINDTIIVPSTYLQTGDLIKSSCVNGKGSIVDGYYYVYVIAQIEDIELLSITLHKTLNASLIGHDRIKLHAGTITEVFTGNEYIFSVTGRAIAITSNLNVRGISNTLRFDRTSYVSKIVPWEPNKFWGSKYNQFGISAVSSDVTISETVDVAYHGRPYTDITGSTTPVAVTGSGYTGTTSSSSIHLETTLQTWAVNTVGSYQVGMLVKISYTSNTNINLQGIITIIDGSNITVNVNVINGSGTYSNWIFSRAVGTGAKLTVTNVLLGGSYNAKLTDGGQNYKVFDTITVPGATLSGITGTNNCFIVVDSVSTSYGPLNQDTTSGVGTGAGFNVTVSTTSQDFIGKVLILTKGSNVVTGASACEFKCFIDGTDLYVIELTSGTIEIGAYVTSTAASGVTPYIITDYINVPGTKSGVSYISKCTISVSQTITDTSIKHTCEGTNFTEVLPEFVIRIQDKFNTDGSPILHLHTLATVGTVSSNVLMTLASDYTGDDGIYFAKYAVSKYTATINIGNPGTNYVTGDTVMISGDRLGGSTTTNDLTINIVEAYLGKVTRASAVTNTLHPAPTTGSIQNITVEGVALDSNFASLQGAVLPIKSETISGPTVDHGVTYDSSNNVIVRLDYTPSRLHPGQIQGAKTYFYHNSDPTSVSNPNGNGGLIEIHKPRFNPYDVTQTYFVKIIDGGTQHYVGEVINVSGSALGGLAGVNDVQITVETISNPASGGAHIVGGISSVSVIGVSPKVFDIYYIQPINETQVQVFHDPGMKKPVTYDEFNYKHNNNLVDNTSINLITGEDATLLDYNSDTANISDFAYIPEPFMLGLSYKYDTSSIVSYADRVWRCIESNNDTVFDSTKWILLQSDDRSINALDRIVAYYQPAINMPAKDLPQLVSGISYPGTVYYGNSFSPEDIIPIDVALKGQELYPRTLSIKGIITNNNQVLITGSLLLTHGSKNVVGNGTLFDKELAHGTKLSINGFGYIVDVVTDDSHITLTSNYNESTKIASAYKFQYIAIGESADKSILMTSIDGVTWHNHILAEHSLNVTSIIYGKDKYLVSTLTAHNPVLLSYNGIDWLGQGQSTLLDQVGFDDDAFDSSAESYPADNVNKIIQGSDGYYYGVGSFITRSAEGIVWNKQYTFGTKTRNIIYNISEISTKAFKGYIAVGGGNRILSGIGTAAPEVTTCSIVITSIDGVTWTLQDYITIETINTVVSNDNIIVIAGNNGTVWYSVNGHNWVQTSSGVTRNLTAGAYVNSRFVLVGEYGTIITSTDGITWSNKTNNSLTVDTLNDITHDGTWYYIVGDNATIIRSSDTNTWSSISMLTPAEPDSVITGNDFLYGYGPEELIPGVITETLSIKVMTGPGSNWDSTPVIPQQAYFQHTSFGMKSVTSTTGTVSFDGLLRNPAQVSVFIIDSTTKLGNRIYTGYTINWITKVVTYYGLDPLNPSSLPANKLLMIEVYEVGNGKQLARGNSQHIPFRTNSTTNHSEIYLNLYYQPLVNPPVVYHNGVKLAFRTDYNCTFIEDTNLSKLTFNTLYNQDTDYITWTILDTGISNFRPANTYGELSYSIPETQTFTNSTSNNIVLTNNIGKLNIANAIVEKNGLRLVPKLGMQNNDYYIDSGTGELRLTTSPITSDTIAVTTFNETDRLFIQTRKVVATANQNVFAIPQPFSNPVNGVDMDPILYTDVNKAWVTINGSRIGSDKLSYDNSNNLTIDATINLNDVVLITVTLDGDTPNSSMFNIDIDKYGKSTVYLTNIGDGTWLTKDFNSNDTSIQVYDVSKLLDTVTQTTIVDMDTAGTIFAYVECNINSVMKTVVYNQTSSSNVDSSKYVLEIIHGRPALVFVDNSQASLSQNLLVTLTVGNILELNGEKIRFTQVEPIIKVTDIMIGTTYTIETIGNTDFTLIGAPSNTLGIKFVAMHIGTGTGTVRITNTLSGLTRGLMGTGVIQLNSKYTEIYGLTPSRVLDPMYYGKVWNTINYSSNFGDPLQISTSPAARFLQYGHY